MSKEQEQLLQWIDESDNIVFFGGAGGIDGANKKIGVNDS